MKLVAEDLEQVLANLGLKLGRSTTKEVWALCPGHDDHNPTSFSVNRDTGECFCFACGYRQSDLLGLTMDIRGGDAWSASVWLREHGASLSARIERVRDRVPPSQRARAQAKTKSGFSIEGEFAVFGDAPDEALEERLLRRDSIDLYDVRWDKGNFIIPVKDLKGKLHGWQRRKKPRPKNYPEEMRKSDHLFGAYEFEGDRAILVESPLDVVRLHSEGYSGALASFGSWVSLSQMRLVETLASKLLIAMDDDEAGKKATMMLVRRFEKKMPTWVFNYDHLPEKLRGRVDPGDLEWEEIAKGISTSTFAAQLPRPKRRVVRR